MCNKNKIYQIVFNWFTIAVLDLVKTSLCSSILQERSHILCIEIGEN